MCDKVQRKVERRNSVDHSSRFMYCMCRLALAAGLSVDRDDLADESFSLACRPRESRDSAFDLAASVDQRLRRLKGDHSCELFAAAFKAVRYTPEASGQLKSRKSADLLRTFAGGRDRFFQVRLVSG